MFEAGLLRAKNTLSIFVQIFGGVTMLSLLWVVVGYTLVYGKGKATCCILDCVIK